MIMYDAAKYQSFTERNIWKGARAFQLFIFNLCKSFPSEEKFRLSDKLIRASRSNAADIAESPGRHHYQEQIQFCRQAQRSLSEVLNRIYSALDCHYSNQELVKALERKSETLLKLINGYLNFLKKQKLNQSTKSTQ